MSPAISTATQVHRVVIKAPAEKIWQALTDPDFTRRYGYGSPSFYELRPGGSFRVEPTEGMRAHGAPDTIIDGEVVECDPPRRLVQTWHAHFSSELAAEPANRLTWEIEDEPGSPGLCRLTVTHELDGAPVTAISVAGENPNAGGGWPYILSDLKTFLETGDNMGG